MTDDHSQVRYTTLDLQKRKVGTTISVTNHAQMSVEPDLIRNQLIYRLESYVMAHQLDARIQTRWERVPSSWWQHFKLEAIKWGNPFFDPDKVKMTRIALTTEYRVWATFPECPIEFPSNLGPARIVIEADTRWGSE